MTRYFFLSVPDIFFLCLIQRKVGGSSADLVVLYSLGADQLECDSLTRRQGSVESSLLNLWCVAGCGEVYRGDWREVSHTSRRWRSFNQLRR